MGNQCVVVDVLLLVGYHTTIALTFSTFTTESEVELVTGRAVVQGDDIVVHTTVGLLVDIDIAHTDVLGVGLLEALEVE